MTVKPILAFGDPQPPTAKALEKAHLIDGAVVGPINDEASTFVLHMVSIADTHTVRIARGDLSRLKLAIEQTLEGTE